jgi:hypothetical protein
MARDRNIAIGGAAGEGMSGGVKGLSCVATGVVTDG